jgi:hypothetical protein
MICLTSSAFGNESTNCCGSLIVYILRRTHFADMGWWSSPLLVEPVHRGPATPLDRDAYAADGDAVSPRTAATGIMQVEQ